MACRCGEDPDHRQGLGPKWTRVWRRCPQRGPGVEPPALPPHDSGMNRLDLTNQVCPMTFVRTRLALDGMEPGERLTILLRGEEPQARVPLTVCSLGHLVLAAPCDDAGVMHLLVEKV
jgi:tRNA 2-thiouridine synthesizing protein A